jgi:hypothetical protein
VKVKKIGSGEMEWDGSREKEERRAVLAGEGTKGMERGRRGVRKSKL